MPLLTVNNLIKRYGAKRVLHGLNITLESGRIMGLMGPNGSGKTTFLKVLACLLRANGGEVKICGETLGLKTKQLVSFLPDRNIMPKWMNAKDAIEYYADFFTDFDKQKASELLQFMNLDSNIPVSSMSKGMVEKLNLSLCFARKAKLYLLDEPLGGVDPVARERIVSAIVQTYTSDSSIIVSTHLVHDIEKMFNDVCFIGNGEIILQGDAQTLRRERGVDIDELYIQIFKDIS
ncbi:MAG: ABC transporter ATP-binding protein [Treponema sp.]|nr:ABC transporter ATP-binding protein [Treponema sp.]